MDIIAPSYEGPSGSESVHYPLSRRRAFQIGQEGVSNLEALNSLVALQKVPYDFGFYRISFEVDHPVMSVSCGRSVVSNTASVPVEPSGSGPDRGARRRDGSAGTGPLLERLRVYVQATRLTELSLDEMASALAEEDFVKARREGQEVTVSATYVAAPYRRALSSVTRARGNPVEKQRGP